MYKDERLEKIDQFLEELDQPWTRLKFTAEQFSHAITDYVVEGLRKLGIGEPRKEKREGPDAAYKLGHAIGAVIIMTTPIWAVVVPFIFIASLILKSELKDE